MIKWIVILIILILVLSYFGISIQSVVNSPAGQSNFSYVWNGATYVWNTYLSGPANYLWNNLGSSLWNAFQQGVQNIKVNQSLPSTSSNVYPQASGGNQ